MKGMGDRLSWLNNKTRVATRQSSKVQSHCTYAVSRIRTSGTLRNAGGPPYGGPSSVSLISRYAASAIFTVSARLIDWRVSDIELEQVEAHVIRVSTRKVRSVS
jgi:hypothetical protein